MDEAAAKALKVAEILGVAAISGIAGAAYYFYGPNGKKHRQKAKAWGKRAKAEVEEELKKMESVTEHAYKKAAKKILAKYRQIKNIRPEELAALGVDLTSHWSKISKDIAALGKKTKKK